ncbi:MAG: hypothetical protein A2945_02895 [Candidatus Liptonbacteria bacterium RIFCSPLOWO2_01_FULL_52_25]|uniref:Excinuclease ABC subunit C n=1 Tax=Candidatus Liptonbacteria bacterium RIFCSPLOWO2_01_FULL_52_25 TaxID=1798650 RepID=A0A1G2CGN1_9BACT|nr:MAG: hypothetical protein A2945_02895 [Candidatus Liptonbacteria bacterium RIFCSPLOWO2_01_FULL_52_25]
MKSLYKNLPDTPGVYLMKNSLGELLYVGKAGNLKRRVSSYFLRPHDTRIQTLVNQIAKIEYKKTDSALEALILEAELIKEFAPPFNIKEKDDKSFLYFEITKEKFPRVLLIRGREARNDVERTQISADNFPRKSAFSQRKSAAKQYGPFTSASSAREALKILRRIFPWNTHANAHNANTANDARMPRKWEYSRHSHKFADLHYGGASRPCFDYEVGLCPGTCIGAVAREEYLKTVKNLRLFFEGKKKKVLRNLEKEMAVASKRLEFEKAEKLRRQIFALQHIRDVALISENNFQFPISNFQTVKRIEGYDVSNISGTSAVGSMVVFTNGELDKNEYRKFRIKMVTDSNPARRHPLSVVGGDVGMLKEMLRRRFSRHHSPILTNGRMIGARNKRSDERNWPLPHLILIDGGRGQVNAAKSVLAERGLKIPVIGIAKGAKRKRNDIIGFVPKWTDKRTLVRVRDEAHRFAIGYHKKVRGREFIGRS